MSLRTQPPERATCPSRRGHATASDYDHHGCRCPGPRTASTHARQQRGRPGHVRRPAGPALVDSTGTRRRVEALYALGWPRAKLAAELGQSRPHVLYVRRVSPRVRAAVATVVAVLYDQLRDVPGPSDTCAAKARFLGYAPPAAWPANSIDDPAATPWPVPVVEADWVVVERLLADGPRPHPLHEVDAREFAAVATVRGWPVTQIADRVGRGNRWVRETLTAQAEPAALVGGRRCALLRCGAPIRRAVGESERRWGLRLHCTPQCRRADTTARDRAEAVS